ncbi:putative S-adenosyl-L-methionine-dependent methyltransferase [Mycobacterium kiyosense]|uniref:S-adenosyl-L-methionine-dependent methyltransferase n=1 Tax=Mycobacterium kiyosense TaxID=2871094 RepID=A0AA37Q1G7_9MYCO|nr:putative S-adenosyl-L-methionine-dependent methyltransferase [Mycobacterium kiyosense]BDE14253.1 putative S-adenosyl-L-methionine-dependent methyltransferase [Mycobacterium sp. 20KCMC460]GLB81531.1 putative S-adenosyl-L-methionine-dependent methyltransferase [Mycobacterium kiyosense]GLB90128.1 putative S-adenosyl-L-methionine-dependent methyltransferase [Mycobacterium kiyosense]GLB93724.1 putative S-adenosyl-L-methionine-dependent methyltransferase [Mycobacterium kiyosense]
MTPTNFGSLRSDDDQWDIVSGVGYTALLVAGWRALHALSPRPLVVDDFATLFIEATADPYLTGLLDNPGSSQDETTFPRLYGVQTRFFDDFFTAAADTGIRQAVIVAAGLDSRAYRLQWPPGTTVFEVDLPKVLEFKARVLSERAAVPTADRVEVAADLRTDWPAALSMAGFDPGRPSAWSVEGLLPYLNGDAQQALFSRIDELCAAGSRISTGALGSCLDRERLAELEEDHPGVSMSGEVDFSALTYADSVDPAGWLGAHGWAVEPVRTNPELQRRYGLVPSEIDVKLDAFMHSQYVTATKS